MRKLSLPMTVMHLLGLTGVVLAVVLALVAAGMLAFSGAVKIAQATEDASAKTAECGTLYVRPGEKFVTMIWRGGLDRPQLITKPRRQFGDDDYESYRVYEPQEPERTLWHIVENRPEEKK